MTPDEIIQRRMANQYLSIKYLDTPEKLVAWFGAVQSQDYPGALWALSQRLGYISKKEIEISFLKGKFLRTHVMRPTWHFVNADDIAWLENLTGNRVKKLMGTYNKVLGLNDASFAKSEKIIAEGLRKKNLTRSEIGDLLKKHNMHWQGNGLAHLVAWAELSGLIASGTIKGKQHTYALLSKQKKKFSKDDALKDISKRYFQSHGPAQIIDFVWWSGLLTADAKKGIQLHPDMKNAVVKGKTYYYFDTPFKKSTKHVWLLPNYDEYAVAFRDREILSTGIDPSKLDWRQNTLFNHTVLIDGVFVGVWRRTLTSKKVTIETKLFRTLTKSEKEELAEEQQKYAKFLGLELK